jgi:hypothetical protein
MTLAIERLRTLVAMLHSLETELLTQEWQEQVQHDYEFRDAMAALKSAVDDVRTTIWCCTKSDDAFECARLKAFTDQQRMQRAVEMLRDSRQRKHNGSAGLGRYH